MRIDAFSHPWSRRCDTGRGGGVCFRARSAIVCDQELTTGRVNVFFLFTPTKMDLKTTDWSVFIMSVPYQLLF